MIKVAIIVGTRPEVIKMAPVIKEIQGRRNCGCHVISTGQHGSMSKQAFELFGLRPDQDLAVMRNEQELPDLTSRLIDSVALALKQNTPDVVLVQGDTTTVLSASIAAFYAKIPVGHVEAGLRTKDFNAPWPEEMNRRLADAMSRWCFCPTKLARENLLREGIPEANIFITGNTVIDALLWMQRRLRLSTPRLTRKIEEFVDGHRFILVTAHRRESFGEPIERICHAILNVTNEFDDVRFVYPVHLNPNVRRPVESLLGNHSRICLTEPADYETFVWLMDRSYFVLTDSGGVQEEAPSLGKPVLVMRDATERPEGVNAGTVRLVGTDATRISRECATLLSNTSEYKKRSTIANPYGDGLACKRIVDILTGVPSEWCY